MKRPLVAVVSCYVIGLLLAEIFQPPLVQLFAFSFALFTLAIALPRFRPHLICALLVLTGWTNLIFHTAVISPNDLRNLIGNETEIVSVRGILTETPKIKISERGGEPAEHSLAQIRITEIRRESNWQPVRGQIVVTTPSVLPENFFAGQSVEVSGVIARPGFPLAEGLFDNRDYLQTRGIYYELKTESTNDWRLREPILQTPPLTDRFLNWSKKTLAFGLPIEDESLRLLWAMTLGWRTAFIGDIGDPFLRAGTMHLFAIDGLRIALISGMLVALLRVLQVSRAWCGIVAIPAIWFYTAASGWESSAIRASVMMSIVLGGWALKRPGDLINSLAAAAFIILIAEPRQLFEASFQLSFCVILVIGLLLPRMNKISDGLLSHDPLLPDDLIPKWRRVLISTLRILARYFSLSFAAWLGSIPLSALYFHLFSPVSPLANLVAVPLGTLALMSNLGALICGSWFPFATELFNHSAWFFMSAMTDVSEWFTKIPGSYFYAPAPSWISIGIYYLVLVVILSGWLKTAWRKIFFATILIFISAIYFWRWENSQDEIKLTVLPLNGGHAVFVDAAGTKNDRLIDCGNENAVNFTLKNFLRAQGVNKIPRLVLTEGDSKNCGGAELLDQLLGVDELWTSGVKFRSAAYRDAVSEFEKSSRHKTFNCGDKTGCWQILSPAATNNFPRADDNALVLVGNFNGAKVLLLSDLGRAGQNELLARTNDLHADIVIAGLPNEGEPLSDGLLDAIRPKVIVIADSEFPANRRASRELQKRLETKGIFTVYTRDSGAVTILARQKGWELNAMDGENFAAQIARKD
ncbi:MAG TPA: ComEC/Rec2 family competence protein [Dongiaceae bacterium]|jgi:competence protein ComEC|nr:ComEC/Rec2 family competence protein [Dongiaceae bacterium]